MIDRSKTYSVAEENAMRFGVLEWVNPRITVKVNNLIAWNFNGGMLKIESVLAVFIFYEKS